MEEVISSRVPKTTSVDHPLISKTFVDLRNTQGFNQKSEGTPMLPSLSSISSNSPINSSRGHFSKSNITSSLILPPIENFDFPPFIKNSITKPNTASSEQNQEQLLQPYQLLNKSQSLHAIEQTRKRKVEQEATPENLPPMPSLVPVGRDDPFFDKWACDPYQQRIINNNNNNLYHHSHNQQQNNWEYQPYQSYHYNQKKYQSYQSYHNSSNTSNTSNSNNNMYHINHHQQHQQQQQQYQHHYNQLSTFNASTSSTSQQSPLYDNHNNHSFSSNNVTTSTVQSKPTKIVTPMRQLEGQQQKHHHQQQQKKSNIGNDNDDEMGNIDINNDELDKAAREFFRDDKIKVSIAVEPANYQVANYNLYPTPTLTFEPAITTTLVVTTTLIESNNNAEILNAFHTGYKRLLAPGGNVIFFTGLKLKKISFIKSELQKQNISNFDTFFLRYRIGGKFWDSSKFRLVSSCAQLPKEVKKIVRPAKRGRSSLTPSLSDLMTLNSSIKEKYTNNDNDNEEDEEDDEYNNNNDNVIHSETVVNK